MTSGKDPIQIERWRRIETAAQSVLRDGMPLDQDRAAMVGLARKLREFLLREDEPARIVDAEKRLPVFSKSPWKRTRPASRSTARWDAHIAVPVW